MMNNNKERNFTSVTKEIIAKFKKQYEKYHDKRYYLTRVKRKGNYIWGLKMFKRARQIEYFKKRRFYNRIHREI